MPTVINVLLYLVIVNPALPLGYAYLFPYLDDYILLIPRADPLRQVVEVPTSPPSA
jgi:hypothetical protein